MNIAISESHRKALDPEQLRAIEIVTTVDATSMKHLHELLQKLNMRCGGSAIQTPDGQSSDEFIYMWQNCVQTVENISERFPASAAESTGPKCSCIIN